MGSSAKMHSNEVGRGSQQGSGDEEQELWSGRSLGPRAPDVSVASWFGEEAVTSPFYGWISGIFLTHIVGTGKGVL